MEKTHEWYKSTAVGSFVTCVLRKHSCGEQEVCTLPSPPLHHSSDDSNQVKMSHLKTTKYQCHEMSFVQFTVSCSRFTRVISLVFTGLQN